MKDRTIRYDFLQMEAALCIWETLLDQGRYNSNHPAIERAFEQHGSVAMRMACIPLADFVLAAYDSVDDPDQTWDQWVYDWEIIPAFLSLVIWTDGLELYELPVTEPRETGIAALAVLNSLRGRS